MTIAIPNLTEDMVEVVSVVVIEAMHSAKMHGVAFRISDIFGTIIVHAPGSEPVILDLSDYQYINEPQFRARAMAILGGVTLADLSRSIKRDGLVVCDGVVIVVHTSDFRVDTMFAQLMANLLEVASSRTEHVARALGAAGALSS